MAKNIDTVPIEVSILTADHDIKGVVHVSKYTNTNREGITIFSINDIVTTYGFKIDNHKGRINSKIKEIIAIAIISFGGLSIHTQIKAILEDTKIIYNFFLKGRIIHVIIGIILVCII